MGAFSAQMSTVLLRSSKQGIQTRTQEMRAKSVNGRAVLCKDHTKYLHALAVTVSVSTACSEEGRWLCLFVMNIVFFSVTMIQAGMKMVRIFSDRIRDRIRLKGFNPSVSESRYLTSDTVFVSEYLNHIFMMSISNRILSGIFDTIRIRIRIRT
jgi:hypothetical protein